MFIKLFIFILLGTSFALASPVQVNSVQKQPDKDSDFLTDTLSDLLDNFGKNTEIFIQRWKKPIEETFEDVLGKSAHLVNFAKTKLKTLVKKYEHLKESATEAIQKEKEKWDEQLKKVYHLGKDTYGDIKKQASEAIQSITNKWNQRLDKWKDELKHSVNKSQ